MKNLLFIAVLSPLFCTALVSCSSEAHEGDATQTHLSPAGDVCCDLIIVEDGSSALGELTYSYTGVDAPSIVLLADDSHVSNQVPSYSCHWLEPCINISTLADESKPDSNSTAPRIQSTTSTASSFTSVSEPPNWKDHSGGIEREQSWLVYHERNKRWSLGKNDRKRPV